VVHRISIDSVNYLIICIKQDQQKGVYFLLDGLGRAYFHEKSEVTKNMYNEFKIELTNLNCIYEL
jgi:hypothetical protein